MAKRVKEIDLIKERLELYLANPMLVMKQNNWTKAEYDGVVDSLQEKIELSKRGKSSKIKGASYERVIAKKFKEKFGIELKRTPMSGGFSKGSSNADDFRGDITVVDKGIEFKLHIECKSHKTWSLPSWLRQAEEDCSKNRIPVVVFHRRQLNKDGKRIQEAGDYISLPLDDFLDIVDESKIIIRKES